MDLTIAQITSPGPVRENNEDRIEAWMPETEEERRDRGAIFILADGIGGLDDGETASQMAVDIALKAFKEVKTSVSPRAVLWQLFNAANLAIYDAGMETHNPSRMGTTLTVSIFRNNEVTIGHVGDCRVYLVRQGTIKRITTDHSYVGLQLKLGLISEKDAMGSELRSVLTRTVGKDPTIRADIYSLTVSERDRIVQCSDGLHGCVTESEVCEIVSKQSPEDASKRLVQLATTRGTDDNLSVQIIQIDRVEQLNYYRGLPVYHSGTDAAMSNEVQVGQTLDNRILITDVINRSGMASIFKATDLKTDQTIAVKVPFMQFESDPGFFSRFEREEEIGRTLDHPYVLKFIPVEDKSRPYIVMEYLEGQTLGQLFHSILPLPVPDALRIASRICDALDYMHKHNVIHRDLKPHNIMLCNDGSIRIMDFGIAKAKELRRITFTGFSPTLGTPDYMAPEQVKGKRGDERTDIYSLGAILYEMVTARVPFDGQNAYMVMNARLTGDPIAPRKIDPKIPPQVEEIILHAMERNTAHRYSSAAEMKADLDNPDGVELVGRADRLQPPQAWKTRWHTLRLPILAMAIPVVVAIIVVLLVYFHPWSVT